MKQLKKKLSVLLIAVMVLTMNVQVVHATDPSVDTEKAEEQAPGGDQGDENSEESQENDNIIANLDSEGDVSGSDSAENTKPGTEGGDTNPEETPGQDGTSSTENKKPTPITVDEAQQRKHTITINGQSEGHTYEAYQIFLGRVDIDGTGKILADIDWGKGVNITETSDDFWTELYACTASAVDGMVIKPFENCEKTAAAVAGVLADHSTNEALAVAFSRVVGKYLSGEKSTSTSNGTKYEITVTGDGYYFVKDKDGSLEELENQGEAYTKYILQVVGNVEVIAKADKPSIDKNILGKRLVCQKDVGTEEHPKHEDDCYTTEPVKESNASIGDTIKFVLDSKVPDMDGYDHYYFVVHDEMSKGLTFKPDSVVITVSGAAVGETPMELDPDTYYTVSHSSITAGVETTIEIIFKDFYQKFKNMTGAAITINYEAELNEFAVIGVVGNPNKVTLTYSNNPQESGKGDYPDSDSPIGKTPEEQTKTYVTGIKLKKVDGNDHNKTLEGAKFSIQGEKVNIVLVKKDTFEEAADGEYYKLKDGTYTVSAPAINGQPGSDPDLYDGITENDGVQSVKTYKLTQKSETIETTEEVKAEAEVSADGILSFEGLAAGKYTITELVAPDGYNILPAPIEVEITWKKSEGGTLEKCTWTATSSMTDDESLPTDENGIFLLNVANNKGTTLPSTGGMGTTIFYAVGSILVLGAAIILIAKKRSSVEK